MSAICGIYDTNMVQIRNDLKASMLQGMGKFAYDKTGELNIENVFFGCGMQCITPESLEETLPAFYYEKGLAITADAIIDNRSELFGLLEIPANKQNTISDSELIVLAYEKWHEECPKRLVGDFAFAIYDPVKKLLFCARDHVGKGCFYYNFSNGRFSFCSFMKPLLLMTGCQPELNEKWIACFLSNQLPIHDMDCVECIYEGIYQLPPASSMVVNAGLLGRYPI